MRRLGVHVRTWFALSFVVALLLSQVPAAIAQDVEAATPVETTTPATTIEEHYFKPAEPSNCSMAEYKRARKLKRRTTLAFIASSLVTFSGAAAIGVGIAEYVNPTPPSDYPEVFLARAPGVVIALGGITAALGATGITLAAKRLVPRKRAARACLNSTFTAKTILTKTTSTDDMSVQAGEPPLAGNSTAAASASERITVVHEIPPHQLNRRIALQRRADKLRLVTLRHTTEQHRQIAKRYTRIGWSLLGAVPVFAIGGSLVTLAAVRRYERNHPDAMFAGGRAIGGALFSAGGAISSAVVGVVTLRRARKHRRYAKLHHAIDAGEKPIELYPFETLAETPIGDASSYAPPEQPSRVSARFGVGLGSFTVFGSF